VNDESIYELEEAAMELVTLENFGVWQLSLVEAAHLIVRDMWYGGEIEAEGLDEEAYEGDPSDPQVRAALAEPAGIFLARLIKAVDIGRLRASKIKRNFDEELIASDTYVKSLDLIAWLEERNHEPGELYSDWEESENHIAFQICEEISWLRSASSKNLNIHLRHEIRYGADDSTALTHSELSKAYKAATLEIHHLRERLAQAELRRNEQVDKPISQRHRRTLLTIIAALCQETGLSPERRGTSQRIKEMTENIGAPVDDQTIRQVIAAIPDAIESRQR